MTSVRENIDNGKYNTKLPYPGGDHGDHRPDHLRKLRLAYRQDTMRLEREVFKTDLEEEFGLVGHPKADKLFDLAWSHGHSAGLHEVLYYYEDFADLVK